MRIALVSREFPPASGSGGIGTYTEKTAHALATMGQDVHVFTEGDPAASRTTSAGAHIHVLPEIHTRPDERRVVLRAVAVARALRKAGPFDVVQACEWGAEAFAYAPRRTGLLITRLATPAYVVNRLNGMSARARLRTAVVGGLERLQARWSDHVISPSRSLAELVGRDWGLDPRRMTVVPTGIEIPVADPARIPAYLSGKRFVLYFGRLERRKGVKTWIDALRDVLDHDPELWAVFAGQDLGLSGTPVHEYARHVLGPRMARVMFLPRLPHSELFPLIAASTLVTMPSVWESLANACLEAMALGKPVIATSGSGFGEVIRDRVNGFLVLPEDSNALARTAIDALADPMRLAQVGQAAAARANDFALDKMAGRLLELYGQLVEPRPSPGVATVLG